MPVDARRDIMTFSQPIPLSFVRGCAVLFLTAAAVCAHGQPSPLLLEMKVCNRQLQVYEDGTMTESRDGKQTTRRLSQKRMRKLRQVIAGDPCWTQVKLVWSAGDSAYTVTALHGGGEDCYVPLIVSGTTPEALRMVEVTRRHGGEAVNSAVYIACEDPPAGQKEWLKRNAREFLKPKWQTFLSKLAGSVGGKSILEGCKCSEDMFTPKKK